MNPTSESQPQLPRPEQAAAAPSPEQPQVIEPRPAAAEQAPAPAAEQTPPAPIITPPAAPVMPSSAVATTPVSAAATLPGLPGLPTPATAADEDVIEKEWVDKTEDVINRTAADPYAEEEAIEELQIEYLQKRYGHEVKKPTA